MGLSGIGVLRKTPLGYYQDITADSGLLSTLARNLDRLTGSLPNGGGEVQLQGIFDLRKDTLEASVKRMGQRIVDKERALESYRQDLVLRYARPRRTHGRTQRTGGPPCNRCCSLDKTDLFRTPTQTPNIPMNSKDASNAYFEATVVKRTLRCRSSDCCTREPLRFLGQAHGGRAAQGRDPIQRSVGQGGRHCGGAAFGFWSSAPKARMKFRGNLERLYPFL